MRTVPRRERCGEGSPLVFTVKGDQISGSYASHRFKRALRVAGLDDRLHLQRVRHSFASWLVQGGATLYEVQRLLGHSCSSVTEIYSQHQPKHQRMIVNEIIVKMR